KSNPPMGGLRVDTREGLLAGGKSGVASITPGKPEESLLLKALQHVSKDLKMPPGEQLPAEQIQAFSEWIKMGAPDPRVSATSTVTVPQPAYDWEKERKHWAYQPVKDSKPPQVSAAEWSRTPIDRFIRAKLEEKGLQPVGKASRLAIIRRITYNLTGLA